MAIEDKNIKAGRTRLECNTAQAPDVLPPLPRLSFTMRETAVILGVNYQTVYRLCKRGLLRSSTALRTKLFSREEIDRFLKATLSN